MEKLTLKLEELRVESFSTQVETRDRRGTVMAHAGDSTRCNETHVCNPISELCIPPSDLCLSAWCNFTAVAGCLDSFNCPP